MSDETILFATVVFWIAATLVVVLPVRWSLIAYLILIQIDLSGSMNYSLGSWGFENALKVVALPTLLLYRVRPTISLGSAFPKLRMLWIAFIAYAAVASIWSPYHLSAIKMLGYFYAYSVLFIVFATAWQKKWIDTNSLMVAVWCCLLLAVVQTYVLGNDYGDSGYDFRLTSFTGAQSFAPFLLSLIVLLWFSERRTTWSICSILAAAAGLILTGSRSLFLGFAWSIFAGIMYLGVRAGHEVNLRLILKRFLQAGVAVIFMAIAIFNYLPDNRVNQMLIGAFSSSGSLQDVGTFAWRFSLYQKALDELAGRSPAKLVVGSGTSSAATLMLETGTESEENVDPNRSINNEFLRSAYEWGIAGFVLLLLLYGHLILVCLRMMRTNSPEAWASFAIAVPLLISLLVENVLADAGSPGGVGYLMVVTSMLAAASAMVNGDLKRQTKMNSIAPSG
jgi:hypothetical protein